MTESLSKGQMLLKGSFQVKWCHIICVLSLHPLFDITQTAVCGVFGVQVLMAEENGEMAYLKMALEVVSLYPRP